MTRTRRKATSGAQLQMCSGTAGHCPLGPAPPQPPATGSTGQSRQCHAAPHGPAGRNPAAPCTTPLLPRTGHGLCCWNKRDVLIGTGRFRAGWLAARRGHPSSRVTSQGRRHLRGQTPCLPRDAPVWASGWGCARVVPTTAGSGCCSPARLLRRSPHVPRIFIFT